VGSLPFPLMRGASSVRPMTDYGPRSSYELEWLPYTMKVAERVVRMTIGQELQARFEAPQDLPREVLTLLMRLREPEHDEK
jgi:hypothetical protein